MKVTERRFEDNTEKINVSELTTSAQDNFDMKISSQNIVIYKNIFYSIHYSMNGIIYIYIYIYVCVCVCVCVCECVLMCI